MIVRRFLIPLTLSAMAAFCIEATAQGAFPAPLPNPPGEAPAAITPPPSVKGTGSWPSPSDSPVSAEPEECWAKITQLRQDAEKRAQALKAASAGRAPPHEACGLLKTYVEAEANLVSYLTTKHAACGISAAIPEQLRANQKRSNELVKAVCAAANHRLPGDQSPSRLPDAAPTRNWGDDIFIPRLMERQGHGR